MDFHSLARRELQALCKKNKIPANTTNIAMADALKALDIVEGMEEFLNPSSVESPGKTVMASPYVPHTGGRTSIRKKTIKEEPESVQISTRARRGTRKAIAGEMENAKIDVAGTPGVQSIRKRAPLASGFRKMETPRNQKEEISVQKVNTRRSTRLLEKKMTELTLNDNEGIEPIDFGGYDKEMTNDTEGNVKEDSDDFGKESEFQGMNQDIISDDLPMETARELEQISEVLDESDVVLVPEEHTNRLTPQITKDIDDEVNDVDKERNADDDILSGENLEKSQDLKDEIQEEEGCDDSGYIDNTAECLVSEDCKEGSKDSADIADPFLGDFDTLSLSVSAASEDQKQDIQFQKQASHEPEIESMNDLESKLTGEDKLKEGVVFAEDAEVELDNHDEHSMCYKHLGTEKEITPVTPNCGEESDQLVIELSYEVEPTAVESPSAEGCDDSGYIDNTAECLVSEDCKEGSKDSADIADPFLGDFDTLSLSVSAASEDQKQDIQFQKQASHESEIESMNDLESNLTGEDKLKEGMVFAEDAEVELDNHDEHSMCYKHLGTEKEITPVTPNCGEESDQLVIESSYEVEPTAVESPSAEGPVNMPEQMSSSLPQPGSDSDCLICPPSLTPLKKSSNKTNRKIVNLLDENKENIDNSGRKLDLTQEKGKKDNNKASDSIKKKSLRQLKKIFKEKVQITNKMHINEDKNFAQVGRARPALQMLSENCLASSEPENKI